MVPDGRTEWTDGQRQNYIPPTSSGDNKAFVYALMVPSWADQLLPQLLMEQFDTLPTI